MTFTEWLRTRARVDATTSHSMRIKVRLLEDLTGGVVRPEDINTQYDLARYIQRETLAPNARLWAGYLYETFRAARRRDERKR